MYRGPLTPHGNYHPRRLRDANTHAHDQRWLYEQNSTGTTGSFDAKLAKQLYTMGHTHLHATPETIEASMRGVRPLAGGCVKRAARGKRKPWQVKGSAAAIKHMAKLRALRKSHK